MLRSLDDDKAVDIVTVDLRGKTTIADTMVVASGTSQRHIAAMADKLMARLKENGFDAPGAEGLQESSWVLIDAGDVIVHLFRAETRSFYDIERLWAVSPPERLQAASNP
ncbi:MAG: ribosome silencing factor [Geminicoccaceae bacterium]